MSIVYESPQVVVHHGDCIEVIRSLPDASVDSIVTDPPYGLANTDPAQVADTITRWVNGERDYLPGGAGFMGKAWDAFVPPVAVWDECMRVLKPGGHVLAFAGTRTVDLMTLGLRLAGFDIRDSIAWLYGSGFPKSLDVSKAIAARQWQGWGTALKPAFEPVVVARKPLAGTVAQNVLKYGTGALNIDANRIATDEDRSRPPGRKPGATWNLSARTEVSESHAAGRFPANVILDESQADELDRQAPNTGGSGKASGPSLTGASTSVARGKFNGVDDTPFYGDKGGASRFFYTAKADASERPVVNGIAHPTVKPLDLMRYLVRLVTPKGGIVLEPFAGSGTTLEAAVLEGFTAIGIEREADYLPLIEQRLDKPHAVGLDIFGGAA